jgi:hypothetical protein
MGDVAESRRPTPERFIHDLRQAAPRVGPPVKPEGCGVGAAAGGGDNSGRYPSPLSFRDLIAESRGDLLKPCPSVLDPAIKSRDDT